MGLVRRLIQELLNIPLDEIRIKLFKELLPQVPDWGLGIALVLILMSAFGTARGLWKGVDWVVRRNSLAYLFLLVLATILSFQTHLALVAIVLLGLRG